MGSLETQKVAVKRKCNSKQNTAEDENSSIFAVGIKMIHDGVSKKECGEHSCQLKVKKKPLLDVSPLELN